MADREAAHDDLLSLHAAMRAAVLEYLDVEAGLREALLASEHGAMMADLAAGLQVEDGLAAIVHRDASQTAVPGAIAWSAGPVAEVVQKLPAAQRLALRSHPSVRSFGAAASRISSRAIAADLGNLVILPYLRDIERVLTRARDYAWHGNRDRSTDLEQALTYAHALSAALALILRQAREFAEGLSGERRAFVQQIALDVDSARERTVAFVQKLTSARDTALEASDLRVTDELFSELLALAEDCDPVRGRTLAEELDQKLGSAIDQALFENPGGKSENASEESAASAGDLTKALHQTPATERADALVWLKDALDDFQGADLRDADLAGVPLDGLRWSESTRWPDQWAGAIRSHSVPAPGEPGVFIIQGYSVLSG